MKDTYQTISGESTGTFKDRGSKFFAYAYPVYTETEWQDRLEEVRKLHFKARHHCYAFRLGLDGNNFRANDDGEPSSTAGRPILGQIDSFELTNVLIVVVRYFGGTKLGTSGLINAYRQSAAEAIQAAEIIQKTLKDIYHIRFDYALMSEVMNAVKKLDLEVLSQSFTEQGDLMIALPQSETADQLGRLSALVAKIRQEEWDAMEKKPKIPGFTLTFQHTQ